MATNDDRGVALMDDCTVRLFPGHNDFDSNSIDQEDLESRSGHTKVDQHRYVINGNTEWATRRQLFYLLVIVAVIATIAFINLIVSSVGVHKIQVVQVASAPLIESSGLLQEIQENELDLIEHGSLSINTTLESSEVEDEVFVQTTPDMVERSTTLPQEPQEQNFSKPDHDNHSASAWNESSDAEHDIFKKDSCIFKWIERIPGPPPLSKVTVGNSSFLVIRARKDGGLIPGEAGTFIQTGSYAYNGIEHKTRVYQILTAPSACVNWVEPAEPGKLPPNVVPGGIEPVTGIPLYICATNYNVMLFFGWTKENATHCTFAFRGITKVVNYKILTSN